MHFRPGTEFTISEWSRKALESWKVFISKILKNSVALYQDPEGRVGAWGWGTLVHCGLQCRLRTETVLRDVQGQLMGSVWTSFLHQRLPTSLHTPARLLSSRVEMTRLSAKEKGEAESNVVFSGWQRMNSTQHKVYTSSLSPHISQAFSAKNKQEGITLITTTFQHLLSSSFQLTPQRITATNSVCSW